MTVKILLIDEDPADRALASTVLSSAFPGSCVCELGDGAHFIAALRDGAYDAVVTEIGIEGAHWSFQLEAIRALHERAALIVFTRTEDPEIQRGSLEAGATTCVVKSTQGYLDLPAAVQNALESAATTTDDRRPPATALGSAPGTEAVLAGVPSWRSRLSAIIAGARALLDHRIGRPIAIFLGIVAISAVVSVLFGTISRWGADGRTDTEAFGIVAAGTAEADEPREETSTDGAQPLPTAGSVDPPPVENSAAAIEARPPVPTAPVTLELRASDTVWVLVTVDGSHALDAIMEAGQSGVFSGRQNAELRIGNAAGLTVIWNGTDIGSLGRPDQVRHLYFTPTEVGVGPVPTD